MPTIVQIADEVPASVVAEIEAYLYEVASRDINWNGAIFKIDRGDFTCIPDDDTPEACSLYVGIDEIIRSWESRKRDRQEKK